MTHRNERSGLSAALESITDAGFDGMADAIRILVNEAMKIERAEFLGANPHERTEARRGYANGFKPKTVATRVGAIEFEVPQVRDIEGDEGFYPNSLERGVRSEQCSQTGARGDVRQWRVDPQGQGVTEKICGVSVTSTQVSRSF